MNRAPRFEATLQQNHFKPLQESVVTPLSRDSFLNNSEEDTRQENQTAITEVDVICMSAVD